MKAIIGVGATKPYNIQAWLRSFPEILPEEKRDNVRRQLIGVGDKYNGKANIVLCIYYNTYIHNRKELFDSKAVVIIVDSPIVLHYAGIEVIDCSVTGKSIKTLPLKKHVFQATVLDALRNKTLIKEPKGINYLQNLMEEHKSAMSNFLQTVVATCSLPEKRKELLGLITYWLLNKEKLEENNRSLKDILEEIGIDEDSIIDIIEFFKGSVGLEAIEVFARIKRILTKRTEGKRVHKKASNSIPYEKLATDFVTSFDIKYLMKIYKNQYVNTELSSYTAFNEYKVDNTDIADHRVLVSRPDIDISSILLGE